jgi:Transposase and inactivated derivatives
LRVLDKERRVSIPADLKAKLWPYIAGIARQNKFKALAVGGMPDHCHALLSLPTTMSVAKAVQLIKGGSSKWINDHLDDDHSTGRTVMGHSASVSLNSKTPFATSTIRSGITQR